MATLGLIMLFIGSALTTYFIMRIYNAIQMAKYIDRTVHTFTTRNTLKHTRALPTIEVEELEFTETIDMDGDWYYDGRGFIPYGTLPMDVVDRIQSRVGWTSLLRSNV